MTRTLLAFALVSLTACPNKQAPTIPTGAAPAAPAAPIAGTLAEAPTHALGAKLDVKPTCNQDSYFKLTVPAGQAFKIDAKCPPAAR